MKFKEFIYFYPEKPVLIHRDQPLVNELSENDDYIAEPKYNGSRCIIISLNGEIGIWNRHGKEMRNMVHSDEGYKELVNEIKSKIPSTGHYQFEGELRHNKVIGLQYKIVLWDCLIYNDEYLNKLTYDQRREYVLKHFETPQHGGNVISFQQYRSKIKVIEQFPSYFRKVFNEFMNGQRKLGHEDEFEGLVIKNRNGKLDLGRKTNPNSKWMFKIRIETGRHKF